MGRETEEDALLKFFVGLIIVLLIIISISLANARALGNDILGLKAQAVEHGYAVWDIDPKTKDQRFIWKNSKLEK